MTKVLGWFTNFLAHPKTTIAGALGGTTTGLMILGAGSLVFGQAGCDFTTVNWGQVAEVVTGSAVVGGLVGGVMRDTRSSTPPVTKG